MIVTPKAEIASRIDNLRKRLSDAGLDGALFQSAIDVFYFTGTRQNSVVWIPADGNPVLLVKKSFSRAVRESIEMDVRPFPSSRDLPEVFGTAKSIGLTYDVLPVQHMNYYKSLLVNTEFSDISSINRDLRSVKSLWELEQMRSSGRMLSEAFSTIPEYLKPGMREIDLAAEFELRLRRLGIGGYLRIRGFNQEITGIAVSGPNAAVSGCFDGPITGSGQWIAAPYGPSADLIRAHQPIVVDYGGFYNGYIVDMTRIFCIGMLDKSLQDAFNVSLEIQSWLMDQIKPGAVCEDLFLGAMDLAARAGLDRYFMGHPGELAKFVGHGVGLELDELPVLAPKFKAPLIAGQTIAIEPKFLFPDRGAVGIENTVAVTDASCERLTLLPDNIVYL